MLSTLALLCASHAALPQDAEREPAIAILRAVPESAVLCAHVSDVDALRADARENAWFKMFQDDAFSGLRDWVTSQMAKGLADAEHEPEVTQLLDSIHASAAFFLVATEKDAAPAGGIFIDPGTPRGPFEEVFDGFVERFAKGPAASTETYASIDLHLFERVRADAGEAKDAESDIVATDEKEESDTDAAEEPEEFAHVALFDTGKWAGACMASSREDVLELAHGAIDRMSGKDPSAGLAASEILADARKSVRAPGRVEIVMDLARMVALARAESPPAGMEAKTMAALGVDQLRWAYVSADVGKGESLGVEAAMRLPDEGYLRKFVDCLGRLPRELAQQIPKDSATVALYQADVWAFYQAVWGLIQEIEPERLERKDEQLAEVSQAMGGGDVEQDLLAQLTGDFASFAVVVPEEEWQLAEGMNLGNPEPPKGPLFGTSVVIGLKGADKVATFFETALTATGFSEQLATEEFQGTEITKLGAMMPIQLSWAFTKHSMVISQYPTALRAALRAQGGDAKESVLENASFKPYFESYAQSPMLGLARTADTVRTSLNTFQMLGGLMMGNPMMAAMAGAGEDNPLALVPPGELADQYFHGTTLSALTKKGGVLVFEIASR